MQTNEEKIAGASSPSEPVAIFRRSGVNTWLEPNTGYTELKDSTPLFTSQSRPNCGTIYTLVRLDEDDTDKVVEIVSAYPDFAAAEQAEKTYRAELQHLDNLQTDIVRTTFVPHTQA